MPACEPPAGAATFARFMKNKLPRYLAAACATLAFSCTVAFADDAKPEPKEKGPSKAALEKYDADKNGKLDDAETARMAADKEAVKQARLAKYDTNKDGKVDKTEAEAEKADKEKMKAEKQAAKEAKKAEREAKKAEKQN